MSRTVSDDGFLTREHEHVTVKLKHCPCCGKTARTLTLNGEDGDYLIVGCPNCGIHTRKCEDGNYEEAAKLWNMRRVSPNIAGRALLSCPFCGGKAEADFCDDDLDIVIVQCEKCGAASAGYSKGENAVKAWNRRV